MKPLVPLLVIVAVALPVVLRELVGTSQGDHGSLERREAAGFAGEESPLRTIDAPGDGIELPGEPSPRFTRVESRVDETAAPIQRDSANSSAALLARGEPAATLPVEVLAEQQLEVERRRSTQRADRARIQLELGPGETLQLTDCYLAIAQHRREALAAMRARGCDRDQMKQTVEDLLVWQKAELTRRFGEELGARIAALDSSTDPSTVPAAVVDQADPRLPPSSRSPPR